MIIKYGFVLLAYLLGSIPFSYILGRYFRHEDIRKYGSGNIGTTNSYRVFGKFIGTSVLILDTVKAGLLVYLIKNNIIFPGTEMFHPLVYGFASVLGHIFPVWFKFRGGKGVATSFGLLLAYSPVLALALIPAFFLIAIITRYISLASTLSAMNAFYVGFLMYILSPNNDLYDIYFVVILFLSVVLIFIRHKSNFNRIRKGTENKIAISDRLDRWFEKK